MFDIVRKQAYWEALDNDAVFRSLGGKSLKALDGLKHIQDAWSLGRLLPLRGKKILEVGGGVSRVLPALDESNERWNLDEFLGVGNGVTEVPEMPGVKIVRRRLGDFSEEVPSNYFDVVFSISVIEHVPTDELEAFWKDHSRVLSPGGMAMHTIDLYIEDAPNSSLDGRLGAYRDLPVKHGLEFIDPPALPRSPTFQCDMASNTDFGMWLWNKSVPTLAERRARSQSVTLGMLLRKA